MKNHIIELISKHPKHYSKIIQKDATLREWITVNSLVETDHWPTKIYSAVHQQTNICHRGSIRKFDRFSTGFTGCGPAAVCACTAATIGNAVSATKQLYSAADNIRINGKRRDTMVSKYGFEFNSQRSEVKEKLSEPKIPLVIHAKLLDTIWLNSEYNVKQRSLSEIADELGVYYGTVGYYCRKAGFTIRATSIRSVEEAHVSNYITSLGFTVENSNRTIIAPKELDIFINEKNIAIEINGLYWHSYNPVSGVKEHRRRHANKTMQASKAGVQLFHITDYEWNTKQSIVKSLLRTKLGLNNKLYARKCQIREVSLADERLFLEKYHIQGYVPSLHAVGLYFESALVMIMTISKSRFSKLASYELLRMCSKESVTVVGGVSKLISHVKKLPGVNSIVTYCDLSKGTGIGYVNAGFTLAHISEPGYFWTNGTLVYSRYRCQKKQLVKWLVDFDESLSESKNLFAAGYRRYWDCGNSVYII